MIQFHSPVRLPLIHGFVEQSGCDSSGDRRDAGALSTGHYGIGVVLCSKRFRESVLSSQGVIHALYFHPVTDLPSSVIAVFWREHELEWTTVSILNLRYQRAGL